MKTWKYILAILISTILLTSCKKNSTTMQEPISDNTSQPATTESATKAPKKSNHTEWKLVKSEKYYSIEKMGLRKYNDYFRYKVFNDKGEVIYSEIIGEFTDPPTVSISNNTVDIHFGYGTNAYCDKYINYKEDLQSVWFGNIRGKGQYHVLAVDGDWKDGSNTKLIVKDMYVQHQEKEYPFPHIMDGCEITKCEFRKNDTEIYIEYTDKDTQKTENKTLELKDFK